MQCDSNPNVLGRARQLHVRTARASPSRATSRKAAALDSLVFSPEQLQIREAVRAARASPSRSSSPADSPHYTAVSARGLLVNATATSPAQPVEEVETGMFSGVVEGFISGVASIFGGSPERETQAEAAEELPVERFQCEFCEAEFGSFEEAEQHEKQATLRSQLAPHSAQ